MKILKKYTHCILDIDAYKRIDRIGLAMKNPNTMICAFEAYPRMFKII